MNSVHARSAVVWLSAIVALLVALGCQALLNALVPASVADWLSISLGYGTIFIARGGSFWPSGVILLLVSFLLGGFVAGLMVRRMSRRFLALLVLASVLPAIFEQFPGKLSVMWLALWCIAGPVGAVFGAVAAKGIRRAA